MLVIEQLADIAEAAVGITGREAGGIVHLAEAAVGVIGRAHDVNRTVNGRCDLVGAAERIIGDTAGVAGPGSRGDPGRGKLANAMRGGVIGPGAGLVRLAPLDHAVELVVGEADGLALGIGLAHRQTERVVGIRPGSHVGIRIDDLGAAHVVDRRSHIAGGIGGLRQIAEPIVGIGHGVTERIRDRDHVAWLFLIVERVWPSALVLVTVRP